MNAIEKREFDMEWRRHFTWPLPMAAAIKKAEEIVKVSMPEPARGALIEKGDALLKGDFEAFMNAIRTKLAQGASKYDALTSACIEHGLVWSE